MTRYAFILPDMSVRVSLSTLSGSGGWTTLPFPALWLARKWCRVQGYHIVD